MYGSTESPEASFRSCVRIHFLFAKNVTLRYYSSAADGFFQGPALLLSSSCSVSSIDLWELSFKKNVLMNRLIGAKIISCVYQTVPSLPVFMESKKEMGTTYVSWRQAASA